MDLSVEKGSHEPCICIHLRDQFPIRVDQGLGYASHERSNHVEIKGELWLSYTSTWAKHEQY